MPTTPKRERRRGYNQAGLLAEGVASELGLPLKPLLIRTLDRRSQIKLEPSQRRANVSGVFAPHPAMGVISGTSVVLVDDVLTTGATASEAATLLIGQGASSVHLATFGRALPEPFSSLP
jgi:predicted amidophosphoribosyltransferase